MQPMFGGSLAGRRRRPERMDQPGLDAAEHRLALRGLGRVNRLSRTDAVLWPAIAGLAAEARDGRPLRVLDVACGGGDVAIALARRASRAGLDVRVAGCDVSPEAVRRARERADAAKASAEFFTLDALHDPLPGGYDVLTCTLFLHHLDEGEAVTLLGKMAAAAGRLVLVDDLIRSRLGYVLATVGCHLLSRSRIVHFDGPASVEGAFTPAEALAMAGRAGLDGVTLARHWPQRFLLSWSR